MLTVAVTLVARLSRVGHSLERRKAVVVSDYHQRVSLFDNRLGRGIEYHFSGGAFYGNDDYIMVGTDSSIFEREIYEWRSRTDFYLFNFKLEALAHISQLDEVGHSRSEEHLGNPARSGDCGRNDFVGARL
jgi:hypothetical protein